MITGLLCGLMMVAMIWMMVAMPATHSSRGTSPDRSQDPPSET